MKSSSLEVPARKGDAVDVRGLLSECALFSTLEDAELDDLAASAERVRAGEGELLFREGEPGDHLYVIVWGRVRLTAGAEGGLEQPIALQGPRNAFGEMALLDGAPRSATAVAARETTLLRVGLRDLERLFQRHPAARAKFLSRAVSVLSSQLRSANARYWTRAGRSLRARAVAAHARSRLASLVSHEFRTPLTVIKACAQRLRSRGDSSDNRPFLEKIEHQCGRLETLVDDLIALSLLQSGEALEELGDVDLGRLAEEVALEMSAQAARKALRVVALRSETDVVVAADRSLVRRALRHLVDNAIKFSSQGEIAVEAKAGALGLCRVSVCDQGIGVDADALRRLSSSFVQEQSPHNRDVEGLGIGLALVTEVARVHGGRLVVESAPGAGSRFALELPIQPSHNRDGSRPGRTKEQ